MTSGEVGAQGLGGVRLNARSAGERCTMNHEHRKISLAERLIVTLVVGISLAVMAVVLIRMASTGAHPVAVCLMAAALVGALVVAMRLWRGSQG